METVSNVTAVNVLKPVLSYAKQGVKEVPRKSQLVRSQAAAGQRQALLNPANGEQQGRVKAQDEQGQAEAHTVSKTSGRPHQMGSANDHFGWEEQKEEEVFTKTNFHAWSDVPPQPCCPGVLSKASRCL